MCECHGKSKGIVVQEKRGYEGLFATAGASMSLWHTAAFRFRWSSETCIRNLLFLLFQFEGGEGWGGWCGGCLGGWLIEGSHDERGGCESKWSILERFWTRLFVSVWPGHFCWHRVGKMGQISPRGGRGIPYAYYRWFITVETVEGPRQAPLRRIALLCLPRWVRVEVDYF